MSSQKATISGALEFGKFGESNSSVSHELCNGAVFNDAFFRQMSLANASAITSLVPAAIGNCTALGVFEITLPAGMHAAVIEFKDRTAPSAFMLAKFDMGSVNDSDAAMHMRGEIHGAGASDADVKLYANIHKDELVLSRDGSDMSARTSYDAGSGTKEYKFEIKHWKKNKEKNKESGNGNGNGNGNGKEKGGFKFSRLDANGVKIKYCERCPSTPSSSASSASSAITLEEGVS